MNDFLKGTLLFAGGIAVGAVAALLLAPKTGEETRKQLTDFADGAKKRAADYCDKVRKDIAAALEDEADEVAQPAAEA